MAIRTARPDDVPALVAGYEWLFTPPGSRPPQWDPEVAASRLERAMASADSAVLVAEVDGAVAGLCTVYLDIESVRFGRRAWVEDLAVDPGRRSAGLGGALLAAAKAWARERGATHLELDSGNARVDAHRFYEREGGAGASRCFGWAL